jgi:arylformamidase
MREIIDLSYEINENMLTFSAPWHPKVEISQLGKISEVGRETRKLTLGSHTGTHVDAPLHFIKNGNSIDSIPLSALLGPVTIINFTHLSENECVTVEMLTKIKVTKRIIFNFGWGKYWATDKFYKNYPFFSAEAVQYLISKKVKLIGLDTPSPDDGRIDIKGVLNTPKDSPMHKLFLLNKVILVEYLANLDTIKDTKNWNICVMPLKIKGGDGSPARICLFR